MRLVIIGGDAAGMSAASQARRLDKEAEIIVLEATTDVSYGACGLPYKIPEGRKMEDLQIITAKRFREERGLDLRLEHEVTALHPADKKVTGKSPDGAFELTYDKLIIATGARVRMPPIPGLKEHWFDGVYPLKTLEDGRQLKAALDRDKPASALVIGAGYIGLEATENMHERGMEVTVVEAMDDLLPFLPEPLRDRVAAEAEDKGIPLHLGTLVQELSKGADGKMLVKTSAGEFTADMVLASTGVQPNSELAADAGLELAAAGSIKVDGQLRTSDPDIYAAGDCADATHGVSGASVWYPLALRANRAGKLAGANAMGQQNEAPPVMGTAVFKFLDMEIARAGLSEKEAADAGLEVGTANILGSTRAHYYPGGGKLNVWLMGEKGTGRLLGGAMVGPEGAAHKIDTVVASLHAGLTVNQLYDMDLAYAPPFGPSWSPLLIAASKLIKQL